MTDLAQSYLAQVEQVTAPPIDCGAMAPLLVVLGAACIAVLVEAFLPRLPALAGAGRAQRSSRIGLAGLTLGLYAGREPRGHHHVRRRGGGRPARRCSSGARCSRSGWAACC